MTPREEQLLQWITKNPMISQQELADRAGITRSAVSVHISNLMKKGYIQGKGYVVTDRPYVVVVGAVNVDIGGFAFAPLVERDSNPGVRHISLGGVGRNIAHNLTLLGISTKMVTVLGDDVFAQSILSTSLDIGLDMSNSLTLPGESTSTYLYLAGPDGDMELAVSDMEVYNHITPEFLSARLPLLNAAAACVVDANIPAKSIEWLAANCTAPIYADTVSVAKAPRLKRVLPKLAGLKPNRLEAELLSGVPITDEDSMRKAARALLDTGLERVFISLGADGLYAAERSGAECLLPCAPTVPQNATGCGDALMAALVFSRLLDADLEQTVRYGLAAGSIAFESDETINPQMSREALEAKAALIGR